MSVSADRGFEFSGTDRFQVLRCLGAGGMGVVYEAFDKERNARVALKTLRSMSPEGLLRFKREFRDFLDLTHPNLISLGELFSEGRDWFFTMELVDGASFLDWVRPGTHEPPALPPLDPARLRPALAQLVEGVMALHAVEKVHRDIKPSNVLVSAGGPIGRAAACSGAMYSTVPTTSVDDSCSSRRVSTASPKSSSTTRPCRVTSTLEGLMSRCTLSAACSAISPSVSCASAARSRGTSSGGRALGSRMRGWASGMVAELGVSDGDGVDG
jgi:serine/threonine protein kinase